MNPGPALADLTTLRVGGPIGTLIDATTEADFISAVKLADAGGTPLLVLGGGSNLVASDAGFAGTVVRDRRSSMAVQDDGACGGVSVTVAAGTPWDDVVARAVDAGWVGIEALSGIPGSTGATPIQNVGAYGQEVADTIASLRTWDRAEKRVRMFARVECQFTYRGSLFKETMRPVAGEAPWHPTPRYVVLDVTYQMRHGDVSERISYAPVAEALGLDVGGRAPLADVRAAVLALRRSKGMVLDPADYDTWSAGSFFTNPILTSAAAASLPVDAPRYPVSGDLTGAVKMSAAWLIEHAGFGKGFETAPGASASLSTKHTLALTNRGDASADDIVTLARRIRDGVRATFGVTLTPEPVLIGVDL